MGTKDYAKGMITLKKVIFVALSCVIIAVIAVYIIHLYTLFSVHENIIENSENYEEETMLSDDREFILNTQKIMDEGLAYISFYITEASSNETVYRCDDRYRAYDFKSIKWRDSDVIVKSGDVGSVEYLYNGAVWERKTG